MVDMPTLVLSPRYTADAKALREAALAAGWRAIRLATRRLPESVEVQALVFYGEPGFVDAVAWHHGMALLCPPAEWAVSLPAAYRKRALRMADLGEARGMRTPAFVKPALPAKVFPAGVYPSGAALAAACTDVPDRVPVLVAEPVTWAAEYRCFVVDRKVVAASPYLRAGKPAQADDASWPMSDQERDAVRAFMCAVLADPAVLLPDAVVIDVGVIIERGWAVVEANEAWASGLYGCSPAAVLSVLARAGVVRQGAAPGDRVWMRRPGRYWSQRRTRPLGR